MTKRFTLSFRVSLILVFLVSPLLPLATGRPGLAVRYPLTRMRSEPKASKRGFFRKLEKAKNSQQEPVLTRGQTVTILADGSSLILGGEGELISTAAIRDARTGELNSLAKRPNYPRSWHSATTLPDGTILIHGGIDANGDLIKTSEIFNPEKQRFESVTTSGLSPRAYHTAALLTDGQVLIAGGKDERGRLSTKVERWDPLKGSGIVLASKLQIGRQKHSAALQPNGSVMLSSGIDLEGNTKSDGEIYEPQSQTFTWTGSPVTDQDSAAPRLEFSLPDNGAMEIDENTRVTLRFSKPLAVKTFDRSTVSLHGPHGAVAIKFVAAEKGMLLFVTPLTPLAADSSYHLTLTGITDNEDRPLPFTTVVFNTKRCGSSASGEKLCGAGPQLSDLDSWIPNAKNLNGDWRSGRSEASARALPPLQADAGQTALAGQVLTLSGMPLANVSLQIGDRSIGTDQTGRFLLNAPKPGRQVLTIQGHTASHPGKQYGTFDVLVDIADGKTTVLPYTIWLPVLDEQNAARLPIPTAREMAITTPRVPGMEVRLPSNAVLRMPAGKHHMHGSMTRELTSVAITPIPVDRPPFPLPPGVDDGLLFTLQLHGAKVQGLNGEKRPGMRIVFPNYQQLPAGTRVDFWNYDAEAGAGWYMYGQGTVTPDRRQVMPDPGVELESMHCISLMNKGDTPGLGPNGEVWDGDPVDLSTGLFVYDKVDLVLADALPISLSRTYRQSDSVTRSFGKGATNPYDMYIAGDTYNYGQIVQPDGSLTRFDRVPNSSPAYYEHTATPSRFYKATMRQISGVGPNGAWEVRLTDGSVYQFGIKVLWGDIFGPHSSITGLSTIKDRYGNRLTVTRDESFRMTKVASPNGRWIAFSYSDTSKRIAQAADNAGRVVSYTYDAGGRLWKVTDANGGLTEYTYDGADRMLTIKDPRGIVFLTNEYDANGRVSRQTQADSGVYQFAYTLNGGKVIQTDVTDPRGFIRRATFSAAGYVLTDTHAHTRPEQQTYVYERQAGTNLILSITDPLNRKTTFTYNAQGRATSVTKLADTPNATVTSTTYEPMYFQVASVTDPLGHTTSYGYNARGSLGSVTNALGQTTTFTYNAAADLASATGPLGSNTLLNYERGNLVEVVDPLGHSRKRAVDISGRLTTVINPLGAVTRYEYDNHNHHTRWIDPLLGTTSFSYDSNGNLTSVTDAANNVTTYVYDNMDRLMTRRDQLLHDDLYEYDLNGNLKKATDRKGQITNFTYDALNRLTQVTYADASTTSYTYDAGSRITQLVDSMSGTIAYGYDNLDRLISETTPQGSVSYTYDAANRRTTMTVAGQPTINYTYDDANRLTQISQGSSIVSIAYDASGRRTSLTLPNGIVTTYGYDLASQLTSITYTLGGNTLGDLTYEYDHSGRRVGVGGSFARSVAAQPVSTATYNAANQQTGFRGEALTYDLNGNLTSDGARTYTWNARGRLASVTGSGSSSSFQYDGLGRRNSKTVDGITTSFLYDGFNIVQEQSSSLGTANILNGGIDEIFSRSDSVGVWSPLRDVLGSSLALSDTLGNVATEFSYEAFGQFAESGAPSQSSIGYTGRENDGNSLLYNRARYYSPALFRFVSEDPIGIKGGMNLYAYVGNSPTNYIDTFGTNPGVGVWGGAVLGGEIGALGGPIGAGIGIVAGGIIGGVATYYATDAISKSVFGPATFPDPFNPPSDWAKHPGGKPDTWIDPNGDTWRWHPDPSGKHGGDHWDIGGPKPAPGTPGGGKGKQDWWPKGGTREPKPPGSMRYYFPQEIGGRKDILEGIEFDPNKHEPIDYAP